MNRPNGNIGSGYGSGKKTSLNLKYVPYQTPVWGHPSVGGPMGVYVQAVTNTLNPGLPKGSVQIKVLKACQKPILVSQLNRMGDISNPLAVASHLINAGWLEVIKP